MGFGDDHPVLVGVVALLGLNRLGPRFARTQDLRPGTIEIEAQRVAPREFLSFYVTEEETAEEAGLSPTALGFNRENPSS